MNTSNTISNPTSQAQSAPSFERPIGRMYFGERIMFIEAKGKDISFNRYRFTLYYEPHKALTHFEYTPERAAEFMAENAPYVYANYDDYRAAVQS